MKATATIICTGSFPNTVCEWHGGLFAVVNSTFTHGKQCFTLGGLELRMIKLKHVPGGYADEIFVMREGRLARLFKWYEWFTLRAFYRTSSIDCRLYRLIGKPLAEGSCIPKLSISYLLHLVSL